MSRSFRSDILLSKIGLYMFLWEDILLYKGAGWDGVIPKASIWACFDSNIIGKSSRTGTNPQMADTGTALKIGSCWSTLSLSSTNKGK
jgi:hypothetical protein